MDKSTGEASQTSATPFLSKLDLEGIAQKRYEELPTARAESEKGGESGWMNTKKLTQENSDYGHGKQTLENQDAKAVATEKRWRKTDQEQAETSGASTLLIINQDEEHDDSSKLLNSSK